jgi:hypothetical protein
MNASYMVTQLRDAELVTTCFLVRISSIENVDLDCFGFNPKVLVNRNKIL